VALARLRYAATHNICLTIVQFARIGNDSAPFRQKERKSLSNKVVDRERAPRRSPFCKLSVMVLL
jgi:hypothetical protein